MRTTLTLFLAALVVAFMVLPAEAATGVRPGSGALNTGKLEDAAHASGDLGLLSLAVRNDTLATLCGTDGDNCVLQVDASGALYVTTAGGDSPAGYAEDAAETTAAMLAMCGSVRRDTAASSAGTTGDNATINTDATGNLWVVSSVLEDVAETAANPLLGVGSVRRDTAASSAGTTGDNATINTNAVGAVYTVSAAAASIVCGQTDVPGTGTAVNLASNVCATGVSLRCEGVSTGACYVRSSAGNGVTGGMEIAGGALANAGGGGPTFLPVSNTNLLWIDVTTNGDDVGWCCY